MSTVLELRDRYCFWRRLCRCKSDGKYFEELPFSGEVLNRSMTGGCRKKAFVAKSNAKQRLNLFIMLLILGIIQDYFTKWTSNQQSLGLSGSIDSALTAVLPATLGRKRYFFTDAHPCFPQKVQLNDVQSLGKSWNRIWNYSYHQCCFDTYMQEQSLFSRICPTMSRRKIFRQGYVECCWCPFSNKFSHILLNTTNKIRNGSGLRHALWRSLWRIMVLADVYQRLVYLFSEYVNRHKLRIPINSIAKTTFSRIMSSDQKTADLPTYDFTWSCFYISILKREGTLMKLSSRIWSRGPCVVF